MTLAKKRILLALAAVLLALLVGEVVLRLVLPLSSQRQRYERTRNVFQYEPGAVQFDEVLGYVNTPSRTVTFANPEFSVNVTTNSAGFRDDEASLNNPAILLLGDSMGFGWGVEKEQTVEAQLEKLLRVRVLNMGVSGYGTVQEAIALQRWLGSHPDDHETRLAIFLFYPNDFTDNVLPFFGLYPNLFTAQNQLITSKATPDAFRQWLDACRAEMTRGPGQYSMVADYVLGTIHELTRGQPVSPVVAVEGFSRVTSPSEALSLMARYLKGVTAERGLRVLFAYIPATPVPGGPSDDDQAAFVKQVTEAEGFTFVDLRSSLTAEDYFRLDDHLRPAGHLKIAQQLQKIIEEKKLLAPLVPPATTQKESVP